LAQSPACAFTPKESVRPSNGSRMALEQTRTAAVSNPHDGGIHQEQVSTTGRKIGI
jgi:hypothetical protein